MTRRFSWCTAAAILLLLFVTAEALRGADSHTSDEKSQLARRSSGRQIEKSIDQQEVTSTLSLGSQSRGNRARTSESLAQSKAESRKEKSHEGHSAGSRKGPRRQSEGTSVEKSSNDRRYLPDGAKADRKPKKIEHDGILEAPKDTTALKKGPSGRTLARKLDGTEPSVFAGTTESSRSRTGRKIQGTLSPLDLKSRVPASRNFGRSSSDAENSTERSSEQVLSQVESASRRSGGRRSEGRSLPEVESSSNRSTGRRNSSRKDSSRSVGNSKGRNKDNRSSGAERRQDIFPEESESVRIDVPLTIDDSTTFEPLLTEKLASNGQFSAQRKTPKREESSSSKPKDPRRQSERSKGRGRASGSEVENVSTTARGTSRRGSSRFTDTTTVESVEQTTKKNNRSENRTAKSRNINNEPRTRSSNRNRENQTKSNAPSNQQDVKRRATSSGTVEGRSRVQDVRTRSAEGRTQDQDARRSRGRNRGDVTTISTSESPTTTLPETTIRNAATEAATVFSTDGSTTRTPGRATTTPDPEGSSRGRIRGRSSPPTKNPPKEDYFNHGLGYRGRKSSGEYTTSTSGADKRRSTARTDTPPRGNPGWTLKRRHQNDKPETTTNGPAVTTNWSNEQTNEITSTSEPTLTTTTKKSDLKNDGNDAGNSGKSRTRGNKSFDKTKDTNGLKASSEFDESDNYPPEFKARLAQLKNSSATNPAAKSPTRSYGEAKKSPSITPFSERSRLKLELARRLVKPDLDGSNDLEAATTVVLPRALQGTKLGEGQARRGVLLAGSENEEKVDKSGKLNRDRKGHEERALKVTSTGKKGRIIGESFVTSVSVGEDTKENNLEGTTKPYNSGRRGKGFAEDTSATTTDSKRVPLSSNEIARPPKEEILTTIRPIKNLLNARKSQEASTLRSIKSYAGNHRSRVLDDKKQYGRNEARTPFSPRNKNTDEVPATRKVIKSFTRRANAENVEKNSVTTLKSIAEEPSLTTMRTSDDFVTTTTSNDALGTTLKPKKSFSPTRADRSQENQSRENTNTLKKPPKINNEAKTSLRSRYAKKLTSTKTPQERDALTTTSPPTTLTSRYAYKKKTDTFRPVDKVGQGSTTEVPVTQLKRHEFRPRTATYRRHSEVSTAADPAGVAITPRTTRFHATVKSPASRSVPQEPQLSLQIANETQQLTGITDSSNGDTGSSNVFNPTKTVGILSSNSSLIEQIRSTVAPLLGSLGNKTPIFSGSYRNVNSVNSASRITPSGSPPRFSARYRGAELFVRKPSGYQPTVPTIISSTRPFGTVEDSGVSPAIDVSSNGEPRFLTFYHALESASIKNEQIPQGRTGDEVVQVDSRIAQVDSNNTTEVVIGNNTQTSQVESNNVTVSPTASPQSPDTTTTVAPPDTTLDPTTPGVMENANPFDTLASLTNASEMPTTPGVTENPETTPTSMDIGTTSTETTAEIADLRLQTSGDSMNSKDLPTTTQQSSVASVESSVDSTTTEGSTTVNMMDTTSGVPMTTEATTTLSLTTSTESIESNTIQQSDMTTVQGIDATTTEEQTTETTTTRTKLIDFAQDILSRLEVSIGNNLSNLTDNSVNTTVSSQTEIPNEVDNEVSGPNSTENALEIQSQLREQPEITTIQVNGNLETTTISDSSSLISTSEETSSQNVFVGNATSMSNDTLLSELMNIAKTLFSEAMNQTDESIMDEILSNNSSDTTTTTIAAPVITESVNILENLNDNSMLVNNMATTVPLVETTTMAFESTSEIVEQTTLSFNTTETEVDVDTTSIVTTDNMIRMISNESDSAENVGTTSSQLEIELQDLEQTTVLINEDENEVDGNGTVNDPSPDSLVTITPEMTTIQSVELLTTTAVTSSIDSELTTTFQTTMMAEEILSTTTQSAESRSNFSNELVLTTMSNTDSDASTALTNNGSSFQLDEVTTTGRSEVIATEMIGELIETTEQPVDDNTTEQTTLTTNDSIEQTTLLTDEQQVMLNDRLVEQTTLLTNSTEQTVTLITGDVVTELTENSTEQTTATVSLVGEILLTDNITDTTTTLSDSSMEQMTSTDMNSIEETTLLSDSSTEQPTSLSNRSMEELASLIEGSTEGASLSNISLEQTTLMSASSTEQELTSSTEQTQLTTTQENQSTLTESPVESSTESTSNPMTTPIVMTNQPFETTTEIPLASDLDLTNETPTLVNPFQETTPTTAQGTAGSRIAQSTEIDTTPINTESPTTQTTSDSSATLSLTTPVMTTTTAIPETTPMVTEPTSTTTSTTMTPTTTTTTTTTALPETTTVNFVDNLISTEMPTTESTSTESMTTTTTTTSSPVMVSSTQVMDSAATPPAPQMVMTPITVTNRPYLGRFGGTRITPAPRFSPSSTTKAPLRDYHIYGIFPNKTIVRKRPEDNLIDPRNVDSPYVIFGIFPDGRLVRKFPNGTIIPDPPSMPVEIVYSPPTTTTTNRPPPIFYNQANQGYYDQYRAPGYYNNPRPTSTVQNPGAVDLGLTGNAIYGPIGGGADFRGPIRVPARPAFTQQMSDKIVAGLLSPLSNSGTSSQGSQGLQGGRLAQTHEREEATRTKEAGGQRSSVYIGQDKFVNYWSNGVVTSSTPRVDSVKITSFASAINEGPRSSPSLVPSFENLLNGQSSGQVTAPPGFPWSDPLDQIFGITTNSPTVTASVGSNVLGDSRGNNQQINAQPVSPLVEVFTPVPNAGESTTTPMTTQPTTTTTTTTTTTPAPTTTTTTTTAAPTTTTTTTTTPAPTTTTTTTTMAPTTTTTTTAAPTTTTTTTPAPIPTTTAGTTTTQSPPTTTPFAISSSLPANMQTQAAFGSTFDDLAFLNSLLQTPSSASTTAKTLTEVEQLLANKILSLALGNTGPTRSPKAINTANAASPNAVAPSPSSRPIIIDLLPSSTTPKSSFQQNGISSTVPSVVSVPPTWNAPSSTAQSVPSTTRTTPGAASTAQVKSTAKPTARPRPRATTAAPPQQGFGAGLLQALFGNWFGPSTTQRPVKTTARPVKSTPRTVQITQKPVQTSPKSVQAAPQVIQTTQKPVQTTPKPVQTTQKLPQSTATPQIADIAQILLATQNAIENNRIPSSTAAPIVKTNSALLNNPNPRVPTVSSTTYSPEDDAKFLAALLKAAQEIDTKSSGTSSSSKVSQDDEAFLRAILSGQARVQTPEPKPKSELNDALLLATLLKAQGIEPSTPANKLREQLQLASLGVTLPTPPKSSTTIPPKTTTTTRRITTTRRPRLDDSWSPSSTYPPPLFNSFNFGNAVQQQVQNAAGANGNGNQVVNAALGVTRAFSQFLGAAISGAAQQLQTFVRNGTRYVSDVVG